MSQLPWSLLQARAVRGTNQDKVSAGLHIAFCSRCCFCTVSTVLRVLTSSNVQVTALLLVLLHTILSQMSDTTGCCSRHCVCVSGIETPRTAHFAVPIVPYLSWALHRLEGSYQACMYEAEEDAAADTDDDDPRPRRWNHAFVVFTAVVLIITALGFGIVDGCLCEP